MILGTGILLLWGAPTNEAIFVGASMVATSVGITAQVLSAKGLLHAISSKIVLAAAVIDDVLGLLVLAAVSSLTYGKLDFVQLSLTALAATAFTGIVAKWGTHTMGLVVPHVDRNLKVAEARFFLAMSLLFALALMAVYTGVAAIVGAFLAHPNFTTRNHPNAHTQGICLAHAQRTQTAPMNFDTTDGRPNLKGPELGISGPALRGLTAGGDSPSGMLSVC